MSGPTQEVQYPVLHPTWYGEIANMFDAGEIACMNAQGLNLAKYGDVVAHASDIYQQVYTGNMPMGGTAWQPEQVATFLSWMNDGYPKGTVSAGSKAKSKALLSVASTARLRKEISTLSDPEIALLKKAFTEIMAKDITDPNSYFVQAGYHWYPEPNTYCMHHVPGYNPWHRAYMLSFENALRSVEGCEDITLPYWDITGPYPAVLQEPPFDKYVYPEDVGPKYPKGKSTQRYDPATIESNLASNGVPGYITTAMSAVDWENFHGMFAGAPNNAIIEAHDYGHISIGLTMAKQEVAAFDPIFWFFHCNWDRLFWKWQLSTGATDYTGLINRIDNDPLSFQIFEDPAVELINPFSSPPLNLKTLDIINSVSALNVQYTVPAAEISTALVPKRKSIALASESFSVDTKRVNVAVKGVNRLKIPGSFKVHLMRDGERIASAGFFQPVEVGKCATCVENAIARFDFNLPLEAVASGKLSVEIEPLEPDLLPADFSNKTFGDPTVEVHFLLGTG